MQSLKRKGRGSRRREGSEEEGEGCAPKHESGQQKRVALLGYEDREPDQADQHSGDAQECPLSVAERFQ